MSLTPPLSALLSLPSARSGIETRRSHHFATFVSPFAGILSVVGIFRQPTSVVLLGLPTNQPEAPWTFRTPTAPERRPCVDCYRRPNRRPAGRSAETSWR